MQLSGAIKSATRHVVDTVLPPRCLSCGVVVTTGGAICPDCWTGIDFISDPFCACCGIPLTYDPGPGGLCGASAREAPAFGRARSVMVYNDVTGKLIMSFKHADRTDAAPVWGEWLPVRARNFWRRPTHWCRCRCMAGG